MVRSTQEKPGPNGANVQTANPIPAPSASAQNAGRMAALDSLRGFLLINMTLTHLPTRVSPWANESFGYVSSAEGFVLLGALLVGWLHRQRRERNPREAERGIFRSAARVYRYHLMLLLLAFTVVAGVAVHIHNIALGNLLDYYLQSPAIAVPASAALLYQPPLFDILPIFVVFLLLSPLLLRAAARFGWPLVLSASGCIWLLAQFHLRAAVYAALAHAGFPIPLREMGSFDLYGWQFLWVAGLAAGGRLNEFGRRLRSIPGWIVAVSGFVAAVLFYSRHELPLDSYTGPALFDFLVSKWHVGILRLLNFVVIGILLVRFGPKLADNAVGRALALPGRRSIEVFSAHLLICLGVLAASYGPDPQFAPWQDVIIVALAIGGLFAVAGIAEGRKKRPGLRRPASSQVQREPVG